MKLAMWTSYLIELNPEDMVAQFAEKGWTHLELSDEHAAVLLTRGDAEGTGRAFATLAEDHGVRIPQGHLSLKFDITAGSVADTVESLKPWFDLFLGVGIRAGVLHWGGKALTERGQGPDEIRAARVAVLKALDAHLRGTDLIVCLENLSAVDNASPLLDLIEAVGGTNLGICLDTGHLNLAGGKPSEFVKQAGPTLQALHIADNEGKTDQHLMPYGRGTVDWEGLTESLHEVDYKGIYNFEIPGENHCPLPVRLAKLDYVKTIGTMMIQGAV
jgi:sugar phosphate isomerase/epimerase